MKWNLTNVIVECASLADKCAYIKWDYFCVENYWRHSDVWKIVYENCIHLYTENLTNSLITATENTDTIMHTVSFMKEYHLAHIVYD